MGSARQNVHIHIESRKVIPDLKTCVSRYREIERRAVHTIHVPGGAGRRERCGSRYNGLLVSIANDPTNHDESDNTQDVCFGLGCRRDGALEIARRLVLRIVVMAMEQTHRIRERWMEKIQHCDHCEFFHLVSLLSWSSCLNRETCGADRPPMSSQCATAALTDTETGACPSHPQGCVSPVLSGGLSSPALLQHPMGRRIDGRLVRI